MFILVVYLVIITFKVEANDPLSDINPEIRLSYEYDSNKNYTVWKEKPLKIVIEGGNARPIRCASSYATLKNFIGTSEVFCEFLPDIKYSSATLSILYVKTVTTKMSTRWACTVFEKGINPLKFTNKNAEKSLHFNVHVKGARAVTLIANDKTLTYVTTNLSVNYDGEAIYTYGDGEDIPMEFSCKKAEDNHKKDTLRLEYYNAEGILLFKTKPRVEIPHFFRSVLKSNNDKYYLDCIRAARYPEREYRYRTTFLKRDSSAGAVQHAVIFSVNGQNLSATFKNDNPYYDDYIFRYIDGEVLNVTCRKIDVTKGGPLIFYADKIINILSSDNSSEAVISLNISTLDIDNKYLTCDINNTDVEKPNARILFLSDVPSYELRIPDLPRHNILYQYTNDLREWTIEYQYSVNDTLNLTCVWNDGFIPSVYYKQFLWKFEDQTFVSAAIEMPSKLVIFNHKRFTDIPFTKRLGAIHNGSKIQCVYGSYQFNTYKIVEIVLRLKANLISEENKIVSGEISTKNYTLVYCLTTAGVSVITILVILYLTVKKSCCCIRSSSQELPPVPTTRPHPDTVFYENILSVFRTINEREAAELENHYEEIE